MYLFLFLVVLHLHCCMQASSGCVVQASCYGGFSCCAAQALGQTGSVTAAVWCSCSTACGIFLDQGLNPRPLHWKVDHHLLYHQGNLIIAVWICTSLVISHVDHLLM